MSVQVAPPSVEDCHFTIEPVWPLKLIVVEEPLQIGEAAGLAVPPPLVGLTVAVTSNLEVLSQPETVCEA